jgi:hypothetical protein
VIAEAIASSFAAQSLTTLLSGIPSSRQIEASGSPLASRSQIFASNFGEYFDGRPTLRFICATP